MPTIDNLAKPNEHRIPLVSQHRSIPQRRAPMLRALGEKRGVDAAT